MAVRVIGASATNYEKQIVRADFTATALLAADALLCTLSVPCDNVLVSVKYVGTDAATLTIAIVDPTETFADESITDAAVPVIDSDTLAITSGTKTKIIPVYASAKPRITTPLWKTRVRLTTSANLAGTFTVVITGKASGAT